jgi:DNA-binding Xre family transcriptional regulator
MTRYRLAKNSKVSYPTLHALYRNKAKATELMFLNKFCYALKCTPGGLLEWRPDRFPRTKPKRSTSKIICQLGMCACCLGSLPGRIDYREFELPDFLADKLVNLSIREMRKPNEFYMPKSSGRVLR